MPTHAEYRLLPYTQEQLFNLVADVERYPEFLPWCLGARVRERFTSRVVLDRPQRIDVSYAEGPFRYLNNQWEFIAQPGGQCLIDFYVDFEFRSRVLQKIIGMLFHEAVKRMVAAFEARARQLNGSPPATREAMKPV